MMAMVDHIDATQEDREAAADIIVMAGGDARLAVMIRAGEHDGHRCLDIATRHRLASTAALQAERDALAARVEALEGVIERINHAGAALAAHPDCTAKKAKPCPAQRATFEFIAAVALAVKPEKNP